MNDNFKKALEILIEVAEAANLRGILTLDQAKVVAEAKDVVKEEIKTQNKCNV